MQIQMFEPEPELLQLHHQRAKIQRAQFAANTVAGYRYDWAMFGEWCQRMRRRPLPASPETVSLYLTDLLIQGKKITTASRRQCAIAHYHRGEGFPSPVTEQLYELLRCAQRQRGEKPRQMCPLTIDQLRAMSAKLRHEGTPIALRDRGALVVGFASALRRASIAALNLADIEIGGTGLIIAVEREKTDQLGRGRLIGIPRGKDADTCSVSCLCDWLQVRSIAEGPLFPRLDWKHAGEPLAGEAICRIVKKRVKEIGLDPTRYGGHSLRSGFVTAAGEAGVGELLIAAQTGHRSVQALSRYFRRISLFRANACSALDL